MSSTGVPSGEDPAPCSILTASRSVTQTGSRHEGYPCSDKEPVRDGVPPARAHPTSLAAGQVYAEEDDGPAQQLVYSETLSQEHDARDDAGEGDEVLVDQHPVGPTPLIPLCQPVKAKAVAKTAE
jgi:hypothetical protein